MLAALSYDDELSGLSSSFSLLVIHSKENQVKADALQLPVIRSDMKQEGAAMGAALVAGRGVGLLSDLDSAARSWSTIGDVFRPDTSKKALYERKLKLYISMIEKVLSLNLPCKLDGLSNTYIQPEITSNTSLLLPFHPDLTPPNLTLNFRAKVGQESLIPCTGIHRMDNFCESAFHDERALLARSVAYPWVRTGRISLNYELHLCHFPDSAPRNSSWFNPLCK